jgi:[ribosomal protein S5]-alanine N-acetyltransferase
MMQNFIMDSKTTINLFPELNFEDISLRIPRLSDAPKMLKFYIENDAFLSQFDPPKPKNFHSLDFWKEMIQRYQNNWISRTQLRFILISSTTSEMIGMISFTGMERGPFHACRLGYKLAEKFTGKGIMTKSLNYAIGFLFEELNFHRIEANYIPENIPSANVLERCGFSIEGKAKDYLFIKDAWKDHVLTSLTNDNWKEISL